MKTRLLMIVLSFITAAGLLDYSQQTDQPQADQVKTHPTCAKK